MTRCALTRVLCFDLYHRLSFARCRSLTLLRFARRPRARSAGEAICNWISPGLRSLRSLRLTSMDL